MLEYIVSCEPKLGLSTHLFEFSAVTQNILRLVASIALSLQEVHFRTLQNTTLDHLIALAFLQQNFKGVLLVIRLYL